MTTLPQQEPTCMESVLGQTKSSIKVHSIEKASEGLVTIHDLVTTHGNEGGSHAMWIDVGSPMVELLDLEEGLSKGVFVGSHTDLVFQLLKLECKSQIPFDNVVIMGEEQTNILLDLEATGVPDALVRQKLYNFDPNSSQASYKTEVKKTAMR